MRWLHYFMDGPKDPDTVTLGNGAPAPPSYTQVLLRSTLSGRGPASWSASDCLTVTAIMGFRWNGLTLCSLSRNSLSPLMLSWGKKKKNE